MRIPPFFSIGLTTYDRVDLLRQSMSSILDQTFADFELIVGNDNPARTLTLDDLGTQDSRVRIINQPRNLGQVGNWRSLLERATGRYFTWIADDDLYAPDFLAACQATLAAHGFPACVYSSFDIYSGQDTGNLAPTFSGRSSLESGSDLLWAYLLDEVQLLGNMGVFTRDFLVNQTPWEEMECPGIALFREYLFVLLAAKLEKVAYIPDSLILYRDHAGSWGSSNIDIEDYLSAGKWLVRQSASMLESAGDPAVQEQLVMLVFNVALKQIVSKRKNASFPVDVDGLFNGFLGLTEVSVKELGQPDAIEAAQSRAHRFFLSLCRQYVVAETGRIEKEAGINRIAEEARQRAAAIDLLTAETGERQRLIEQLTAESGERLRVSEERRQLIERLNDELALRDQIVAKHGPQFADTRATLAQKGVVLDNSQATLAQQYRALADTQVALVQKDRALADTQVALAQKDRALANLQAALALRERVLAEAGIAVPATPTGLRGAALAIASKTESELHEKEVIIRQLAEAVKALRLAHLLLSPKETLSRLVSRLRAIVRPRLGNLNQHAPVPLRRIAPYSCRTPGDRLPMISVVTPSYQQGAFIERTMRSLLGQAYPNTEYVVQDGGSTDGTLSVLERYASQITHWESGPDRGQPHAVNLGLARTTGEIMGWLNSDDLLLPGALACVGDYFAGHPQVDVVYGDRLLIDEDDMEIGRWILPGHDEKVLGWADYVPQETLFWRRSIWEKVGGKIDESFQFAMDWDLLVRFRDAGARFAHIPRFLGAFRIHDMQKTSATMSDVGFREMDRIRERIHGHVPSHAEISKAIRPFLIRHLVRDLAYRTKSRLSRTS
jgi:glycosyltransferase involved in cell wall biosynthesis